MICTFLTSLSEEYVRCYRAVHTGRKNSAILFFFAMYFFFIPAILLPATSSASVAHFAAASGAIDITKPASTRILYFAPHPDDEVICLGGFLADAVASGTQVFVAVVTDGAAFTKALRARQKKPSLFFRPHDYRTLGRIRRAESMRALDELRVPSANRFFLGYPSNALLTLFKTPLSDSLIRCRATAQRYGVAEWGGTRRKPHPFSRAMLTQDIDRLLLQVHPDLVIIPHPEDSNSDHQAVSRFVLERISHLKLPIRTIGYLVHRGSRRNYPKPYGYHPESGFDDPPGLLCPERIFLTHSTCMRKERAIRQHNSQIRLKDGFLLSFIRFEELYWPIPIDFRPGMPVIPPLPATASDPETIESIE
ncbi:MAG: PIG-L family deacetylase [Candidatus Riflebacteria bacterium]|nr:PIG-L family deacetylase [Candidatus Riflebacteria bacterium]